MLLSLTLIVILSLLFLSFAPRALGAGQLAVRYKARVLSDIEARNHAIRERYDLY
jgi:hypothetical protein